MYLQFPISALNFSACRFQKIKIMVVTFYLFEHALFDNFFDGPAPFSACFDGDTNATFGSDMCEIFVS